MLHSNPPGSVTSKSKLLDNYALSQYLCLIHPGELPDEDLIRNIPLRYIVFGFFTFLTILHHFVHPGKNIELLIAPSQILNFTSVSFDNTPVILLSH